MLCAVMNKIYFSVYVCGHTSHLHSRWVHGEGDIRFYMYILKIHVPQIVSAWLAGMRRSLQNWTKRGRKGWRGREGDSRERAAVSEEEQTEWQNRDNRKTSSEGSAERGSIVRGEREVERVQ